MLLLCLFAVDIGHPYDIAMGLPTSPKYSGAGFVATAVCLYAVDMEPPYEIAMEFPTSPKYSICSCKENALSR